MRVKIFDLILSATISRLICLYIIVCMRTLLLCFAITCSLTDMNHFIKPRHVCLLHMFSLFAICKQALSEIHNWCSLSSWYCKHHLLWLLRGSKDKEPQDPGLSVIMVMTIIGPARGDSLRVVNLQGVGKDLYRADPSTRYLKSISFEQSVHERWLKCLLKDAIMFMESDGTLMTS